MNHTAVVLPPSAARSVKARLPDSLAARLGLLALLLLADKLIFTALSGDATFVLQGLARSAGLLRSFAYHAAIAGAASLALFAWVRGSRNQQAEWLASPATPVSVPWLAGHLLLVAAIIIVRQDLYLDPSSTHFLPLFGLYLGLAIAAVLAGLRAISPWAIWMRAARQLGVLWAYAGATAVISTAAIQWAEAFWPRLANVTFAGVYLVLAPFIPTLRSEPQDLVLATDRFAVNIAPACSGVEGAALILIFCSLWLLCFRQEYRFPRALLLLPLGLGMMFVLNILRIAALIAIGQSGHVDVAIYGFHSQAGWITFLGGAGMLAQVSRFGVWRKDTPPATGSLESATAAYLLPFLAILATGMLASAASAGFEWLYPLRVVAFAAVLWFCRGRLRQLDWRVTWRGPAVGVAIFLLWVAAGHFLLPLTSRPSSLASASPALAVSWIAMRALGGIVAAPVAEELAFRGYLLRRWQGQDFESLAFTAVRWLPLLLTSVVFGLSHGGMWFLGIIAGWAYGALLVRGSPFGDCVAAHATTNALLALVVLTLGQWQFW